jgi:glycosyltransferase involved in cell wall biosynthesis
VSEQGHSKQVKACWIGGTRYSRPLNPTLDAKWRALTELDAELYVVGFASGLRPRRFSQQAHFYLMPQLPTSILRYLEMYLLAPWLLLWLIRQRGVNVIIAQSPFEGAAAAVVKRIVGLFGRRVALVVESHGDFEMALFTQRKITFISVYRWLMRRSARYSFRHADVLRAVSDSTRQQLEQWSPGTPIEQFMAWIDFEAFGSVQRERPLAQSWDLLYAGLLIPRKNVHILIEAFAQIAPDVPAAHLWLVGKPENQEYTEQLKTQVERLDLKDRVIFVGAVQQKELAGYMARARAMALVSSSEGLPRVIMEAMFGGLVVIGSRVSGIPEVIRDGVTGYLVPPDDTTALVGALRKVYEDADIDTMGQRARAFAQAFFSRQSYINGYKRLLETALDPTSHPPPRPKGISSGHQQGGGERTAVNSTAENIFYRTSTDSEQTDAG